MVAVREAHRGLPVATRNGAAGRAEAPKEEPRIGANQREWRKRCANSEDVGWACPEGVARPPACPP